MGTFLTSFDTVDTQACAPRLARVRFNRLGANRLRWAIALYGKSGAGKTTVADYLMTNYGFVKCSTGKACRDVCKALFNSESKTLLNRVTDALKAIDEDVWLRAAVTADDGKRPVVFDSMRFANDYRFLSSRGFLRWKIIAPLNVRVMRLQKRGQEFDPRIDEVHRAETELDSYEFDVVIDNCSMELAGLYTAVDERLRSLDLTSLG